MRHLCAASQRCGVGVKVFVSNERSKTVEMTIAGNLETLCGLLLQLGSVTDHCG
jgi:hypothetical protein